MNQTCWLCAAIQLHRLIARVFCAAGAAPSAAPLISEPPKPPVPPPSNGAKRRTLPLVSALLAVFIIAAVGGWVAMAKPFSAAPITDPAVSFQDSALGFSLNYPTGWTRRGRSCEICGLFL